MTDFELEQLYNKNFVKIYRFFYYKVLSKELAEDLTSESFMKFLAINKTKQDILNKEKYLFGVVKLVFLNHLRNKYNSIKTIPIETEQDFGAYVDNFIKEVDEEPTPEDLALKFIHKLPEKQKIVVKMRLIEKKSLKEICEILQKDMNYVKTTQKRALKNLKILLSTFNVH